MKCNASRQLISFRPMSDASKVNGSVSRLFHEKALSRYTDHDWKYEVSVDGRQIANLACSRDDPGLRVSTMKFLKNGGKWRGNLCFTALVSHIPSFQRVS
jgi:hypothetical protein